MSGCPPSPAPWPLDVFPVGNVAAGAQLWRYRNQLHVTLVAKATFALVPGGEARPAPAEELVREAIYAASSLASPLLLERELAPWLPCAGIVFTGHAYAPAGVPTRRMPVGLALRRGDVALVDRRLTIVGDRSAASSPDTPEPEPQPFLCMPIVYQRAWGGPGHPANPVGVGMAASRGRVSLPNVLAPDGSRTPAGLGPIPTFWPARGRLLRGASLPELSPIPALPDDMDGTYFQAAPEAQRFDSVRGGEHIVLEGLHPQHPVIETRLPALRGLAALFLPSGAQRWLVLSGDSLIMKGDAGLCSVVFRNHFQMASDDALSGLRVAVGVEVGGQPVAWPTPAEVFARPPVDKHGDEPARASAMVDWSITLVLGDNEIEEPGSARLASTLPLEGSAPQDEKRMALAGPDAGAALHAPFPITPAGARSGAAGGDIPGAPWATQQPSVRPSPPPLKAAMFAPMETVILPPVEGTEIEPPTEPKPRLKPEPPAPAPPASPSLPHAAHQNVPMEPSPAPPPPTPPPRPSRTKPDLARSMYKRFRVG